MANFVVVVDPDPMRRAAYLRSVASTLVIPPAMHAGECPAGAFAAAWNAVHHAPISVTADADRAAVVWGYALRPDGTAVNASGVRESWENLHTTPEPWDGFFAAVRYDAHRGLVAGADILGLFPVYYWSGNDVLLLGSSVASFRAHPLFESSFNPVGAAGILLTGGLVGGETMWRGVRRLSPGRLLAWSPHSGAREIAQYTFPIQESLANRSFDDQVMMMDEALDAAIARHVPAGGNTGILLSGGRDSRVVAGLLHRRAFPAHAITMGETKDYDAECGASVAKTLGFTHTIARDPVGDVEALLSRHIETEQLGNGLANFYTWGMVPLLEPMERVLSGYRIEDFIGGTARALPGSPSDGSPFDRAIRQTTSHGIAPARLRRLLRADVFADAVDDCLERLRDQFDSTAGDDDRRGWHFDLMHWRRFHAGSTPWRLCLGSWPLMLALDQRLVRLCAALPASTLLHRRAQDELLRRNFPALARLPLDRNSHVTEPLLLSTGQQLKRSIAARLPFADPRRPDQPDRERRRYYRLYDINVPMWQTVRRMAEANRHRATEVLDAEALASLLPPPDTRIELRDPITDSNGLKALLGFMIWWSTHA